MYPGQYGSRPSQPPQGYPYPQISQPPQGSYPQYSQPPQGYPPQPPQGYPYPSSSQPFYRPPGHQPYYQPQQQYGPPSSYPPPALPPRNTEDLPPYTPPGTPSSNAPAPGMNGAPIPNYPPPSMPPPPAGPYESVVQHRPPQPPPQWPQQQVNWAQPPQQYFQQTAGYLSSCTGNKKALLVGVNYFGTRSELKGCINDVRNMKNFLITKFGFRDTPETMLTLTDDQRNWHLRPTRQNILQAMQWLVRGSKAGDSLFFHFSGHGSQTQDLDGDESDGVDETICPEDYAKAGMIVDDEMNMILVRALPPGVRLTALFDCCHSGSALDLPFIYLPDGRLKEKTAASRLGGVAMDVGQGLLKGGIIGAGMSLFKAASTLTNSGPSREQREQTKGNQFADVVMFSGCKDRQTSADAHIEGADTGAMTYGFTTALSQYHSPTYGQLLQEIRTILQNRFTQKPQLSSARYMDMNQIFIM
ncbi:uncharacterized protein SPPG_04744 [Spizellomyces punctatus DAOM BR117]|uniref:Peptidase C14 caspase domain-containing protein n=1 Tax=Spizellomyces punctatus (strain DAOM BR117) TaxID=645134 RepID=A0A0L0HH71_SPIPD|nr:uncharacterized protein SPPG_04744 [Spizellomyces punctatus DAOM BR117]KND00422.1 hypothetical protein SPPG_04744 [Spizellomyces punctatus DAOM BR117]|eukprot:XP_016608461.1 hypothetical protein SPPG_04744 [Spizellomyces punctatus DAOM BR117]